MSVTSTAANIDWQVIATGAGIFIASVWATYQGLKKGREKVESGSGTITSIVGGTLMDNVTMRELSDALRQNSECLRQNTAAITRATDIDLIQNLKLDHRDERDHP